LGLTDNDMGDSSYEVVSDRRRCGTGVRRFVGDSLTGLSPQLLDQRGERIFQRPGSVACHVRQRATGSYPAVQLFPVRGRRTTSAKQFDSPCLLLANVFRSFGGALQVSVCFRCLSVCPWIVGWLVWDLRAIGIGIGIRHGRSPCHHTRASERAGWIDAPPSGSHVLPRLAVSDAIRWAYAGELGCVL
jgi:hypothetical protein